MDEIPIEDLAAEVLSPSFLIKIKKTRLYADIVIKCENGEITLLSMTQKFKVRDFHKILEM